MCIVNGSFYASLDASTRAIQDMRTPIYYDLNDTGYYLDPNGTSDSALRIRGGALHGPNTSWGQYLYVGTNGRPSSDASVCATDGNLHVDCKNNHILYLNYYSARPTICGGDLRSNIYYDSDNTGYYVDAASTSNLNSVNMQGGTVYGPMYFLSNRDTNSSNPPLQAYSSSGGAIMSFHRGGVWAINMGLDSDNVFRIGGWSASTNRLQMDMSGNLTMAGNVTAYSDERLKKDWAPIYEGFIEHLAAIRAGTYTRIDSGERQAGVSAQAMREILPEVVNEDNEGTLALAYGNAALVAAVELAKELVKIKQELAELRSKFN
jgi:hypothetical protein